MNYTIQRTFSNDVAARILELELSQELHDIYSHPHWIKFMDILSNTTCEASLYTLRQWAESHYQLAPLIQWFHSCVAKYGLCFDIYSFIPPSRLILHKRCQEKILHYEALLHKCERKLAYYQELEQMLLDGSDRRDAELRDYHSDKSSPSSAPTSCWSILTSHTAFINSSQYSNEPNAVQNAPFRPCDRNRRKNQVTLPPLETIYLPHALHLDVRP